MYHKGDIVVYVVMVYAGVRIRSTHAWSQY